MAGKTSVRLKREDNAVDVSRALRKSLEEHDLAQIDLAAACGVDQQLANRWCSVTEPHAIHAHDLLLAPREVAIDVLRRIASAHGCEVVPAPNSVLDGSQVATAADVLARVNALTTVHLGALADGAITDAELEQIRRAAHHAIESVLRTANWATTEQRERAEESARTVQLAKRVAARGQS